MAGNASRDHFNLLEIKRNEDANALNPLLILSLHAKPTSIYETILV